MRFNPRFNTKKYHRRGFRLRGNTLVLLFIFFLIGLFLHYGGRTQPVVAFWNDIRHLVGLGRSRPDKQPDNPYKAPEPDEDVASDKGSGSSEDKAGDERPSGSASDKNGNASDAAPGKTMFDFEKQVDFALPAFQSADEVVRRDGYVLRYRDAYKNADWVAYPLLANEITGDADRDGEQFKPDPLVETGTALPSDYTRSGYDRGHLAPAGDFKFSQRLTRESFYMSNVSPQEPQFNRGIWKELEELVRRWAVRDNGLYVVTGSVLKPGLPTIGRANEVSVPGKFYKVILYCDKPNVRMIGFLLDNKASNSSLKQFVVPVDQIEQLTGIDFFPRLPDDLERSLESKGRGEMVDEWFSY
ncbi:DNA/RNA non-specific endonuclease [Spirosoma utsteinense]|uniref:Endonuclease n=1 Tax=Spirosoma utsteinense TaxID=2585773 RepID=A0ABR6W3J0_9BACT|nr:DNA/RNA non-specific endonuclease [Spirosoma utsteinense]MBC3785995.1 endonuclease G [Spirosoma utsteinense]MBC3790693.1 endonuclease G [Spirosoma utsteinense]